MISIQKRLEKSAKLIGRNVPLQIPHVSVLSEILSPGGFACIF